MKPTSLSYWLHAFFHDWSAQQRNLSHHTVISYRDTWRLFLRFVADRKGRSVSNLEISDLDAQEILAFLGHGEQVRKVTIGTRNCRLAALRSFFRFVADREPLASAQCAEILRIPTKRTSTRALCYLDVKEVSAILKQPDRSTIEGQRDHALLTLLYNTGARIQEALDLCARDVRFKSPAQVKLTGKGRKERICPIWPETVDLLARLLQQQPRPEDQPIFVNRYVQPLGAAGVRFKLAQYVGAAAQTLPSLKGKRVTPHTFRHTVGVGMVSAGVDVTVIRSWLGHVSLDTTNIYAHADIETKRRALEQMNVSARPAPPPRWKRNADLLSWLDSL
jgi:site-specific recombinase XerD